jgi:hypothetical protein
MNRSATITIPPRMLAAMVAGHPVTVQSPQEYATVVGLGGNP